jgi:Ca2+-dependent lipid-binding protein
MAQGRLRVTIVEAAKLADKDTTDFNDPYVEVYVDEKKKHVTSVLKDVERPVWNESFDLYVFNLSLFLTNLRISFLSLFTQRPVA